MTKSYAHVFRCKLCAIIILIKTITTFDLQTNYNFITLVAAKLSIGVQNIGKFCHYLLKPGANVINNFLID